MYIIVRNDTGQMYEFHELDFNNLPNGLAFMSDMQAPYVFKKEVDSVVVKPLRNKDGNLIRLQALEPVVITHETWIGVINPYMTDKEFEEKGIKCIRHRYNNIPKTKIHPYSHFVIIANEQQDS